MKIQLIIIILLFNIMTSCSQSQSLGPGYDFSIFKNTPNSELAKAVENEDTITIDKILKNNIVNIDFQEPQYGSTILLLAISNGKVSSVKVLLEHGASLTITDSFHNAAIHAATEFIHLRKNAPKILELLLKYGANPNALAFEKKDNDTIFFNLPLMQAVGNLACTKLLLDYGANLYYKTNEEYPILSQLFIQDAPFDENIFVAKYLIVDKHMKIPNPVFYTKPEHLPRGALYLLNKFKVYDDPQKIKAKAEILDYLKKINFPQQGVYIEKK